MSLRVPKTDNDYEIKKRINVNIFNLNERI